MCISAGNEGNKGEGLGATKPFWTAIGAVNKNMIPQIYSSWGKGLVKYSGISGESITYDYFGKKTATLNGTSFACPQHATQVMNMMVAFKEKYGRKPRIKEVLSTLETYVTDIHEPSVDLKTGLGYYEYRQGEMIMEFKDKADISTWALSAIEKAKQKGILIGDNEGNVKPKEPVTLERMIVILDRLGLLGK
jgi:hypothetical protein